MRIRELRKENGWTQYDLANMLGVSRSAVAMWELNRNEPATDMLDQLASLFGCSVDYLLERTDDPHDYENDGLDDVSPEIVRYFNGDARKIRKYMKALEQDQAQTDMEMRQPMPRNMRPISQLYQQRIPLIGKVAAGEPIYSPEDYDAYVDSPVKCDAALEVQGDSMIPKFEDGDLVYVRSQPDVEDGQIAVVFLDDEAVIKRVYHDKDGLTLLSDNPTYAPIRATFDEYDNIRIFGVPVGLTRMFKPNILKGIRKGMPK